MVRARLGLLAFCLVLATLPLFAQKYTATLTGTVMDSSGALVPGAAVTVTQPATGATRTGATDSQGRFVFTELSAGTYTVSIKREGFKEAVETALELHVGDVRDLRVELTVGAANEVIEVQSAAVAVETQTGAVSNTILGQQVRELPLNGHNFIQLTTLMPGVSTSQGFDPKAKGLASGIQLSVSGGGANNNLFLVDGANNNDIGSNNTILLYPSVEAIAEFKVLRNNYGPEYGQASGGQINLITRGGTNDFHGSAYYFGRNDALAAWTYEAKQNRPDVCPNPDPITNSACDKQSLRRHDFGYTIGGPILNNKLFFFWSQEWNRETRSSLRSAYAPTAAEKAGDFSQTCPDRLFDPDGPGGVAPFLRDPATGLAYPGNQIPVVSSSGSTFIQQYPDANFNLGDPCADTNFVFSLPAKNPWREENIRGDWKITDNTNLMIRYVQDSWDLPFPVPTSFGWGSDPYPAVDDSWSQPSKSAVAKLTTVINSTMVNDFQFSWSANRIALTAAGLDPALRGQVIGAVPSSFPGKDKTNLPPPAFSGASPAPEVIATAPWENRQDLYVWRDDLSKVFKSHTLKAGILYSRNAKDELQQGDEGGTIDLPVGLNGVQGLGAGEGTTGNGFADLLVPNMFFDYSEDSIRGFSPTRWRDLEFYVGDTWKVKPNLTLEFGLRWSLLREPYLVDDHLTGFNPAFFDPLLGADPCNGLVLPEGSTACADAGFLGGTNFSNRALVENNNHAIAPRLGFAWDITGKGKTVIRGGVGQFFNRDRLRQLETALSGNPPFSTHLSVQRALDDPTTQILVDSGAGIPTRGIDPTPDLANSWQWNLTVEHELWRDAKLEVGYVGNRGIHLISWNNVNQIPAANRLQAALEPDELVRATLRPFGVFGDTDILVNGHHSGSSYHSLQSQFSTRFTRSSVFQLSYTWSKLISDSSVGYVDSTFNFVDNANHRSNRGLSDFDRRHIFVASLVYYTPPLAGQNAFLRGVFGNWELNTIVNLASGAALNVTADPGSFPAGISQDGVSGTGSENQQFPNRVPDVPCHIDDATNRLQWLNPDAFTYENFLVGSIGTARPGDCTGPPTQNVDFALNKNWNLPIGGKKFFSEGLKLQFRLEFFNLFNHPQFGGPGTGYGVSGGTIDPITNRISGTSANEFGRVGSAPYGNREIQYALKLIF